VQTEAVTLAREESASSVAIRDAVQNAVAVVADTPPPTSAPAAASTSTSKGPSPKRDRESQGQNMNMTQAQMVAHLQQVQQQQQMQQQLQQMQQQIQQAHLHQQMLQAQQQGHLQFVPQAMHAHAQARGVASWHGPAVPWSAQYVYAQEQDQNHNQGQPQETPTPPQDKDKDKDEPSLKDDSENVVESFLSILESLDRLAQHADNPKIRDRVDKSIRETHALLKDVRGIYKEVAR
jgi:hypothetical protein